MPPRQARGFALLIVLWTVALLALLGSHITAAARRAAALSLLLQDAARAEALADGLVQEALFHLLDPPPRGWKADGVRRVVRLGGGRAEVAVLDHSGRVNPALATPQVLAALLRLEGVAEQRAERLAAALVDWRTIGDTLTPGGAKAAQYRAAGLPYGPPNEYYRNPEELGLVLGMTPDVLERLAPHVSVWNTTPVDLSRADPVVAQAVQGAGGGVGQLPQVSEGQTPPTVVEIVAQVTLPGARAMRRVVVRLIPGQLEAPQPWQILAWD
jgi:general secretion pathway protein K